MFFGVLLVDFGLFGPGAARAPNLWFYYMVLLCGGQYINIEHLVEVEILIGCCIALPFLSK